VSSDTFVVTAPFRVFVKLDDDELGTEAAVGRHLQLVGSPAANATGRVHVELCEDGYKGWAEADDYSRKLSPGVFKPNRVFGRDEIAQRIPAVLAFVAAAMATPNEYKWGGTLGPDFDCSGLVQTAFASEGIWLPRDAHEQYDFTENDRVSDEEVAAGDLIFFRRADKVHHVGIHNGDGCYTHSSRGENGITRYPFGSGATGKAAEYQRMYAGSHRVARSYPGSSNS
jgi:cell wall-associated NlpC family hydrolase